MFLSISMEERKPGGEAMIFYPHMIGDMILSGPKIKGYSDGRGTSARRVREVTGSKAMRKYRPTVVTDQ